MLRKINDILCGLCGVIILIGSVMIYMSNTFMAHTDGCTYASIGLLIIYFSVLDFIRKGP